MVVDTILIVLILNYFNYINFKLKLNLDLIY